MPLRADQLSAALQQSLQSIYLISGDETLLVEEACDAVLGKAREQGFTERSIHHVESGFKWHDVINDAASMSLFAERKVLDLRIPAGKFDKEASQVLRDWADGSAGNPDTLLLIRTERLQPRQRSSAWFKAIESSGTVVLIWPLAPRELPGWLEKRLQGKGLALQTDALHALAERVEGNLLAAAQEVEKLALQNLSQPVSQEALLTCLEDTSRFNSFDLIDAAMAGQGARVSKILSVLREDKGALFAVLGALTSQLRRLGETRGLPPARARTMEAFARRGPSAKALLAECAVLDQQGKGQRLGEAWIGLEQLLLSMAQQPGQRPPSYYQRKLKGR
ncbi:MAG: DNA polymerase III subunit delta [Gammaproteobacteria bacterium]|nr:DNA polymerase III subunit delta [Gammaproteobacteria bacterium]|tara:strand:- start:1898 stop:2902 length:1005 start_codon:yes stop_codon:yes gene_type:complete